VILDSEVYVILNPRHINYWENKGYFIPRYDNSYKRNKVKRDAKILVSIKDLSKQSHVKIKCLCEMCGKVREINFNQYRDICFECSNKSRCGEKHPRFGKKSSINMLNKQRKTKIKRGIWLPDDKLDAFSLYRKLVKIETKKWKDKIFELWNGMDYYTGKRLIKNEEFSALNPLLHVNKNKLQPTIDHKISVYYGFVNNISYEIVGGFDNLCICSKVINSTKSRLNENSFIKIN
jgi:hypothetical protein